MGCNCGGKGSSTTYTVTTSDGQSTPGLSRPEALARVSEKGGTIQKVSTPS